MFVVLGEGTFGKVEKRGNVAVKVMKTDEYCIKLSAWREITAAALCNHPNIIKINEVHIGADRIEIHMPLFETDLFHWWHRNKGKRSNITLLGFYQQIAMGLQYIHGSGIIHADIKPSNILINGKNAVITDFGICVPGGNNRYKHRNVQTAEYRAPEVVTKKYSYPIDCWSLGIMIAEITFGITHPADNIDTIPISAIGNLCRGLLEKDPNRRCTATQAVGILAKIRAVSPASYVPTPLISRPIDCLPIMKNADDFDEDRDIAMFANRLYENTGCNQSTRQACFYLTSCVYNFTYDGEIDAKNANIVMPGLRFVEIP